MGKVVYRKEKKSRFPYPLLILGAVVGGAILRHSEFA